MIGFFFGFTFCTLLSVFSLAVYLDSGHRDYGETEREAYDLAIDSISTAIEMYQEEGRHFPVPMKPRVCNEPS